MAKKKPKGTAAPVETSENYFAGLIAYGEELNRKGNEYLKDKPFLSNPICIDRIWHKAKEIFEASGRDWEAVPEWVADTMDGWMPYAGIPNNGSLLFSLTYSPVAHDALLRNFLEVVEGRETEYLDFKYCKTKDEN